MLATSSSARPRGLALMLSWRRLAFTLGFSIVVGFLFGLTWKSGPVSAIVRTVLIGLDAMLAFGLFEQWPKRLPRWLERWVLQVAGVAVSIPLTTAAIYWLTTAPGAPPFYTVPERWDGFMHLFLLGLLLAPWV